MDIQAIKQIVELMKVSDLTDFEIEEKDLKLRISRNNGDIAIATANAQPQAYQQLPPQNLAQQAPAPAPEAPAAPPPAKENDVSFINSPMVGTFYRAASPESDPYVEVGSVVKADTVVCIVEAMKVMNEIQAEIKGKIVEALVENGESVEFGQALFKVKTTPS